MARERQKQKQKLCKIKSLLVQYQYSRTDPALHIIQARHVSFKNAHKPDLIAEQLPNAFIISSVVLHNRPEGSPQLGPPQIRDWNGPSEPLPWHGTFAVLPDVVRGQTPSAGQSRSDSVGASECPKTCPVCQNIDD
jgi:hypothetical protein